MNRVALSSPVVWLALLLAGGCGDKTNNLNLGPNGTCSSGDYICNGRELQICNDQRDGYRTVEVCTAGQVCDSDTESCVSEVVGSGGDGAGGSDLNGGAS